MRFISVILFIVIAACNEKEAVEPEFQDLPGATEDLEALLQTDIDEGVQIKVYWKLYQKHREEHPAVALKYLLLLENIAKEVNDNVALGKSYFGQGRISKDRGDYIKAVDSYLLSINAFEKTDEQIRIAFVLNNLGGVFAETGNYEYAIRFFTKAKEIYSEANNIPYLVLTNINLGISNFSKVEPDDQAANDYFQGALRLNQKLDEKQEYYFNRIYTQIGTMNHRKGEYDAAVENFLLSLQHIDPSKNAEEQRAIGYANIGEAFMGKGDYIEARKWLKKAFDLSTYIEDSKRVVAIYNTMGELTHLEGEVQTAADIFEKAITIANKEVINPTLQETLKLIRVSYKGLKQVSKARYDNVLTLDGTQDVLEKEMVDEVNFNALQEALSMKIILDKTRKEKQDEAQLKTLYIGITLILAALTIAIAVYLSKRYRRIKREYRKYSEGLSERMREGFERLEKWEDPEANWKWLREGPKDL